MRKDNDQSLIGILENKESCETRIRWLNSGRIAECFKSKHKILLVKEAEQLATLLTHSNHLDSMECECLSCMEIENSTGCLYSSLCIGRVKGMLNLLPSKWNPNKIQPNDELRQNSENEQNKNSFCLNLCLAASGLLENVFRIFTKGPRIDETYTTDDTGPEQEVLVVWTYGVANGK